ncbi:MAG: peptidoglycan DD-metalloendopeptidase family protein [Acidobacteriota bacterium]
MKRFLVLILLLSISIFPSKESKLKKLNAEIKSITGKISQLNKESGSVLNELYKIELNYKKAVSENKRISHLLSLTNSSIRKKEAEKRSLERDVKKSKASIKKAVRILNKIGKAGNFKIFSNIKDINQLFRNYYLFVSLINKKIDEIGNIKILLTKLRTVRTELEKKKARLSELKKSQRKKINEILITKKAKTDFINQINSNRKKHLSMLDELKAEAKRLTNLLKEKVNVFDLPDLDLKTIKGNLAWPIKGKIISRFGKKRSTRFNTYIFNNGVEIKPSGSMQIKAVFDGVIIFMDYFKGYGDIIIVQHSGELLSVYGHCSKFLKKKGDYILAGDEIGIAGDSGSTFGNSLYFEIRRKTIAEDPLKWLKKREGN